MILMMCLGIQVAGTVGCSVHAVAFVGMISVSDMIDLYFTLNV